MENQILVVKFGHKDDRKQHLKQKLYSPELSCKLLQITTVLVTIILKKPFKIDNLKVRGRGQTLQETKEQAEVKVEH